MTTDGLRNRGEKPGRDCGVLETPYPSERRDVYGAKVGATILNSVLPCDSAYYAVRGDIRSGHA
jgi:hypothetical protein